MAYIPHIDDKGAFVLKAPFNQLINPKTIYTCRSIRSINEFIALGDKVYEKFYKPLQIPYTEFEKDFKANTKIAGLQAGTGDWIYVPCSYIEAPPVINGVKYVPIVLGVSLGAVADTFNIDSIVEQFKQITLNSLGINAVVKAVITAAPTIISEEDHKKIEDIRKSKITVSTSDKLMIEQLQKDNIQLREKIDELEKYIKSTL